jgi:uncharacterized protein (TIGR00251 family)
VAEPWTENEEGLLLTVRVTPKASRSALAGAAPLPDGRTALAVRLAAPPVEGAANAELIAFLSKALGVPKSSVTLASGATARIKTLRIVDNTVADRLRQLLAERD